MRTHKYRYRIPKDDFRIEFFGREYHPLHEPPLENNIWDILKHSQGDKDKDNYISLNIKFDCNPEYLFYSHSKLIERMNSKTGYKHSTSRKITPFCAIDINLNLDKPFNNENLEIEFNIWCEKDSSLNVLYHNVIDSYKYIARDDLPTVQENIRNIDQIIDAFSLDELRRHPYDPHE
ncbi:MAG: hypothetical protein ACLFPQ_04940 [Candidatus Woesearchaeota archaeon]